MSIHVTVLNVVQCDRCGKQAQPAPRLEEAKRNAEKEGFRVHEWLHENCPRQTAFCGECVKALITDEARQVETKKQKKEPGK